MPVGRLVLAAFVAVIVSGCHSTQQTAVHGLPVLHSKHGYGFGFTLEYGVQGKPAILLAVEMNGESIYGPTVIGLFGGEVGEAPQMQLVELRNGALVGVVDQSRRDALLAMFDFDSREYFPSGLPWREERDLCTRLLREFNAGDTSVVYAATYFEPTRLIPAGVSMSR